MSCISVFFDVMRDMVSGHFGTGLLVGVPSSCHIILWQVLVATVICLSLVLFWRR
jgi:hypothetical protein